MIRFKHKQLVAAVNFGQVRTENSRHRKDNWGLRNIDPVEDSRRQTVGTLGEWAVANYFGIPYVFTVNTFKAPDVFVNGVGLQVKASEQARDLIIRPDAKDDEPYILVQVSLPGGNPLSWANGEVAFAELIGWLYPWQARLMADCDDRYWRDPGKRNSPAIFIPRNELYPLDTLRQLVYNGS
jgi:hypothetical protein